MWKLRKSKKKMESVMIYTKITELKDRYMIYNAVTNERKWEDKKMDCDNEELEATKQMREKKADQIFEELGYTRAYKELCEGVDLIIYTDERNYKEVYFNLDKKFYSTSCINENFVEISNAINKKIEELGW